jgi:hypothetical protein
MEHEEVGLAQWPDDVLSWTRSRLKRMDMRVRRIVHERPLLSLLAAAAFGCLMGRAMSRR